MTPEWLGAVGSIMGGIAAIMAVIIAHKQLRNLNRTLRHAVITSVIQLETDMNARKQKCDDAALHLQELMEAEGEPISKIIAANDYLNGCMENWLNAIDRFAFCILHKYVREKEWRSEYTPYLKDLMAENARYFAPDSKYDNILKLARRWNLAVVAPTTENPLD